MQSINQNESRDKINSNKGPIETKKIQSNSPKLNSIKRLSSVEDVRLNMNNVLDEIKKLDLSRSQQTLETIERDLSRKIWPSLKLAQTTALTQMRTWKQLV